MTRDTFIRLKKSHERAIHAATQALDEQWDHIERLNSLCEHWSTYMDTNNEHGIPVKRCDLCGRVVE